MNEKPKGYTTREACENCAHSECVNEYGTDMYICKKIAKRPRRPKDADANADNFGRWLNTWRLWIETACVDASAICDKYKQPAPRR